MEAPTGRRRGFLPRDFAGAPLPWIMPVILVIGVFYLYPVLDVFRLSLTNATLIGDNPSYTLDLDQERGQLACNCPTSYGRL